MPRGRTTHEVADQRNTSPAQREVIERASLLPVTVDDLRQVERALFQSPTARFTTTQRMFFEVLLAIPDFDYKKAADHLSIPRSKAKRWLQTEPVQRALDQLLKARMQRLGIDKDLLLLKIVDLLEMSMGDKPIKKVAYDKDLGGFVQQDNLYETDLSAAARFTDQLGKHFELFQPEGLGGMKVQINMDMGGGPDADRPRARVSMDTDPADDDDSDDPDYSGNVFDHEPDPTTPEEDEDADTEPTYYSEEKESAAEAAGTAAAENEEEEDADEDNSDNDLDDMLSTSPTADHSEPDEDPDYYQHPDPNPFRFDTDIDEDNDSSSDPDDNDWSDLIQ